jgi:superfamily II DNA/RNA helicase
VDLNGSGEAEEEPLDTSGFVHVDDFNESVMSKKEDFGENIDKNENEAEKMDNKENFGEKTDKREIAIISDSQRIKKNRIGSFKVTDLPIPEKEQSMEPKANKKKDIASSTATEMTLDMSAWTVYPLHKDIIKGLEALKFDSPTDIQRKVLSIALKEKRDIVGAAQTGSGKTLAFGLPMLNSYCQFKEEGCLGLVIVPTRELAMQVTEHLKSVSKFTQCKTVSIVGGLSHDKQKRLLNLKPQIIVATPGRFWELISEEDEYLNYVKKAKYLVLDEADKMLESGRFKELEQIMKLLRPSGMSDSTKRTFLFSATLLDNTMSLKTLLTLKKPKSKKSLSMQDLLQKMNFQDADPAYVNLTAQSNTIMAQTLTEKKIDCLNDEKIHYLYSLLYTHPGRTVVFVNSIDGIRRLVPILSLLRLPVYGLHAEMQQRQRLKNLDRFRSNQKAILIASDVAARGLDIPNVDHVIHYQLPRTADLYVHRSGRTARANKEGLSIMLCSAEEVKVYRKICQILKHGR